MKVLSCKDIGVNCDYEARGATVEDVLKKATEHARKDHQIGKVTEEYLSSWRKKIHEA